MLSLALTTLAASSAVSALPATSKLTARGQTLEWENCTIAFEQSLISPPPLPYECATLTVPFDYTDRESSEGLDLDLIRVKAINGTSQGSIVFNPGGPGGSGVEFLAFASADLHEILGGGFDLVSFDPRGTGKTLPFDCNSTAAPLVKRDGPTISRNMSELISSRWENYEDFAGHCAEQNGRNGSVIGTTFTARDMAILADALDEDGLLNYWGISYGTYLGTMFATLYPERVGKFVLDSNINPYNWRAGHAAGSTSDADEAYLGFLSECIATPENCTLAEYAPNGEVEEIVEVVNKLDDDDAFLYTIVKYMLFATLYAPSDWSLISDIFVSTYLNGTIDNDIIGDLADTIGDAFNESMHAPPYNEGVNALHGIFCSDSEWRADGPEDMQEYIALQQADSSFADVILPRLSWPCPAWDIVPKESYRGVFGGKTHTPILVTNGIYDPITPLESARNVSAIFEDSVLLQHNGFGHGVISHPSLCTGRALRRYFETGELPEEGTECEPDVAPFALESSLADLLTGPPTRKRSEEGTFTEEDVRLLRAMRDVGRRQNRIDGLPLM